MEDGFACGAPGQMGCPGHVLTTDADRGEVFCRFCGVVLTDKLPDERYGGQSGAGGVPADPAVQLTMHDKGLYTVMGGGQTGGKFDRLRRWDKRAKSSPRSRNLGAALTLLHGLKSKLAIPENVTEKAAYYYRKALDRKLIKSRSAAPMLLACLYAACRQTHTPRSLDDISAAGNIRKTSLSRAIRLVVRDMDLKLDQYDMSAFVTRMANNVGLRERTKRDALKMLDGLQGSRIADGKNPVAFATAALYVVSLLNGEPVTQSRMASASGISAVTIRNTSALIRRELGY